MSQQDIAMAKKSNLLDLVLTNNSYIVNDIIIEYPVVKSDHATIIVNLDMDVYENIHIERRVYYTDDYISIYLSLLFRTRSTNFNIHFHMIIQ